RPGPPSPGHSLQVPVRPHAAERPRWTPVVGAFAVRLLYGRGRRLLRRAFSEKQLDQIREDFPALQQEVKPGVPLVYLDNAATSQKPRQVLEELNRFYAQDNSNVHRGMHTLSMRSTEAFEGARKKVAQFINAPDEHEIVFTRNATEAINLVARTWGAANIQSGDEILLTVMEHHSNLVPWQQLAQATGAVLKFGRLAARALAAAPERAPERKNRLKRSARRFDGFLRL
ncbi:unnamed protein product, partial [Effrenium voratum]